MFSAYADRSDCGDREILGLVELLTNESGTMSERPSKVIDVSTWNWEECYRWFDTVHKTHQLPFPRLHPGAFQDLSGYYLLHFKEEDFHYRVPGYGSLFYREFKRFLLCKNENPDPVLAQMMKIYNFQGVPKEELDIYLNVPKNRSDWLGELVSKATIKIPMEELEVYLKGNIQTSPKSGASANYMGASCHYQSPRAAEPPLEYKGNQYVNAGYGYQDISPAQNYASASSTGWSPVNNETGVSHCMGTPNPNIGVSGMPSQDSRNYGQYTDPLDASQPEPFDTAQNFSLLTTSQGTSTLSKKDYGIEPWQFVVLTLLKGRTDLVRWEDKPTYSINLVNPQALTELWNIYYRGSFPAYTNLTRGLRHIYPIVEQHGYSGKHIYRLGSTAIQYFHSLSRDDKVSLEN